MAKNGQSNGGKSKRVTRYSYDSVMEPRTPETGHTALLPADEQVVTVPMDNGWSKAIMVGKLPEGDERPVVLDMDPAVDPVLFWAGKRNRREVPILPLQRNEVVSDSRIAHIIDRARSAAAEKAPQFSLGFADLEKSLRETDKSKRVEFYTHEEGWKNKLICGDSLQVMESLLQYEELRGKVQMIYIDPPYGIDYDSNFQQRVDTPKNQDGDQADDVLTIKAFRDTWTLGIHSYLTYLQERLYLCRELLSDTGAVFMQIGPENAHVVKVVMDEVFGKDNRIADIHFIKAAGRGSGLIDTLFDQLLFYSKDKQAIASTFSAVYSKKGGVEGDPLYKYLELPDGTELQLTAAQMRGEAPIPLGRRFRPDPLVSEGESDSGSAPFIFKGESFRPPPGNHWKLTQDGLKSLVAKSRIFQFGKKQLRYKRYPEDSEWGRIGNIWQDTQKGTFQGERRYVVKTADKVVSRCVCMVTRPGDLVLDITCGSGTTAVVAESLGRRWITCDTSRVAINVARTQLLEQVFSSYKTITSAFRDGFVYEKGTRLMPSDVAYEREPQSFDLVDRPIVDGTSIRVTGPFEVMTLGRYSVEDWKGSVVTHDGGGIEQAQLQNYIEVICRLYRKDSAVQGASGLVHAIAESKKDKIAISVGPLSGRVTAKQVNDAVQDALASGILEVHVLGWAFEANVGEVKAQLEKRGKVRVVLQMIRPDTLSDGLKATKPEMLFSPLALPDIEIEMKKNEKEAKVVARLKGVAVFDRKNRTTDYKHADSGYISAWYLDEDYDGDCFVACQMFFDFKKAPNLKALVLEVDPEEFKLQLTSLPFPLRGYKRVAVKVVDVFGNESTVVREL